ncbi:MAG: hypothetical protein AB7F28_08300 [Candidatus Margulisiibacteriota bacterium]
MIYSTLQTFLRKHLYIVFNERFTNDAVHNHLERMVAKHPKTKPELIVLNDQPVGFRGLEAEAKSLEKYRIYVELEYAKDEDARYLDVFDLYTEVRIKSNDKLSEILALGHLYEDVVTLDRIRRLKDGGEEGILIYSRLGESIMEACLEQDLEEGLLTQEDIEVLLDQQLSGFLKFIQDFDAVYFRGLPIEALGKAAKFREFPL